MFGYVTVGVKDLQKSKAFFSSVFEVLDTPIYRDEERLIAWAKDPMAPALGICTPFNGKPASAGNGTMLAIFAQTPERVQAAYAAAIAAGGTDEGAPGLRPDTNVYAGYFRDLDGNKFNIFCMPPNGG